MHTLRDLLLVFFLFLLLGCANEDKSDGNYCGEDEDFEWSGCWHEIMQYDCKTQTYYVPDAPIGELLLSAYGMCCITWEPFETRIDFEGTVEVDEDSNMISILPYGDYSNAAPLFDGNGYYRITREGYLELTEMWIGSLGSMEFESPCGHIFEKTNI